MKRTFETAKSAENSFLPAGMEIRDGKRGRYELWVDGKIGFAYYASHAEAVHFAQTWRENSKLPPIHIDIEAMDPLNGIDPNADVQWDHLHGEENR